MSSSPRFLKKVEGDIVITSARPSVCPLYYLCLNLWTESNQTWCVSYLHGMSVQWHIFCPVPWGSGEGSKGQVSISEIFFIPNFVCVLTNKIYKTSNRIFILSPGSCPRGGTFGCWGPKFIFSEHGHVAYQIEGDDE